MNGCCISSLQASDYRLCKWKSFMLIILLMAMSMDFILVGNLSLKACRTNEPTLLRRKIPLPDKIGRSGFRAIANLSTTGTWSQIPLIGISYDGHYLVNCYGIRGRRSPFGSEPPPLRSPLSSAWARCVRHPHHHRCTIGRTCLSSIPGGDHTPAGPEQDDDEDEDLLLCCFDPTAPVDPSYYIQYDETNLASEEAMWALYEWWRDFYCVERSHDEMLRRFGTLKDNILEFGMFKDILEFNKSGASVTKALKRELI